MIDRMIVCPVSPLTSLITFANCTFIWNVAHNIPDEDPLSNEDLLSAPCLSPMLLGLVARTADVVHITNRNYHHPFLHLE